jgi:membrane-bound lytic murein transglycosylase MltF
MTRRFRAGTLVALLAFLVAPASAWAQAAVGASPAPNADTELRRLDVKAKLWTGDFDSMLERRMLRVRVPFSRSLYFNDNGHERGLSAETVRGFEKWLNGKYAQKLANRPLTVFIRPKHRDELLTGVAGGLADIAVGNLTMTPERLDVVDFVLIPGNPSVNEVVATGPTSPALASVDDLAGKTVHVRRSSSYFESLEALNQRFANEGRPLVKIVFAPENLEDEDLLEMLDAGILEMVVVDDWKGKMWAQVLPDIQVNEQVVLRAGSRIGWAIRKGSPKLAAEILAYFKAEDRKGDILARMNRYMQRVKRLKNPTEASARNRYNLLHALFDQYGQKYRFDPLMLAAQGYQESRLDQEARSPVGAVGVMQVMPATGKELQVGDIHKVEPNIHAGAKYMDQLMTKFFPDAHFDALNRTLFAFASYNAGPGAITRMREGAVKVGLDPNVWFDNVEIITARKIGSETTTYVRNIYKYYVAYALLKEAQAEELKAREELSPVGKD